MKAVAVFPGAREVKVIAEPSPGAPGDAQALLRVIDVGVCGTDREIVSFEYGTVPRGARCPHAIRGLITRRPPLEESGGVLLGREGGLKNVLHVGNGER